jgi:hypothetical protein
MFAFFTHSEYMPCPECGASVLRSEQVEHECDENRRLDFQVFQLRGEVAAFDAELADYLASPSGRFEVWYAARERRLRV